VSVVNAIILAGGKGSRLEPWYAPKCLLPINGVPILYRQIDQLYRGSYMNGSHTVSKFILCTGYRAQDVKNAVYQLVWTSLGVYAIEFVDSGEDTPMGQRLFDVQKFADSRVIILYGDELADVDICKLVAQHERQKNQITFAAAQAKSIGGTVQVSPDFEMDEPNENASVRIIDEEARWVNIGFAVVEPECWEKLKSEDGLSDWINRVSDEPGAVGIYYHHGKRATVNSLADLRYAEEMWR
jgi:glucose-1-phosphate cytidylyltransferase